MILTQRHVQVLRDIYRFNKIKRYHGLLPEKHAMFYDADLLTTLEDRGLIEEGTVIARCGKQLRGYRLTEDARKKLKDMGVSLSTPEEDFDQAPPDEHDELGPEHVRVLADMYHFSQVAKYNGITPRHEIEDYPKNDVKLLYDLGYILYIKLKGAGVKYSKGYILTEAGLRLLRAKGYVA